MSGNNLSSKISTNILKEFIIKNKCECDCEHDIYIKIIPKEFDDLYMELYKQLLYNVSLIKLQLSKKTIVSLIKDIDNIITSFCSYNNNYSQYGDDKIFYACIPFYIDYNQISTIKISNGINFFNLMNINEKTDIDVIYKICSDLIETFSRYLIN